MAEFSFPWPETAGPVIGDGDLYTANEWSQGFEALFGAMASDEGVIPRAWNTLTTTAPAVNVIRVQSGLAVVHGHIYWNTANNDLAPASAPAATTRKDRVVLHCDWIGAAQYTVRLKLLAGTALDYPALTQVDDNAWEIPLYSFIIDDAGAITDLTDEREYCHFGTDVSTAMIEDLAVTTAKIDDLAVTNAKLGLLSVDTPQIAANAITEPKCGFNVKNALMMVIGGELTVGDDQAFPIAPDAAFTHTKIQLLCKVAPTVSAIIAEVECNGVPITNAGNRPQIAAGATAGNSVVFAVAAGAAGEVYTLNVDQIGAGLPGEDLTCLVWGTTAPVA